MVDEMANFPPSAQRNPAFDVVGRQSTIKELDVLAKKCEGLTECLESLHGPAIDALAEAGFSDRHLLLKLASQAYISTQRADVSNVPESQGKGRPEARLSSGIARILAFNYQELTGNKPTINVDPYSHGHKAYGPFLDFVKDVFNALGVRASPEASAREAIEATRESRDKKWRK